VALGNLLQTLPPLPTMLVGSYVQPDWLIDRHALSRRAPPRVPAPDLWCVPPAQFEAAADDATLLAIDEQERIGLDVIGDGEIRRESYSCTFVAALGGIDSQHSGTAVDRRGKSAPVPRVVGPITWTRSVLAHDVALLRSRTSRPIKITLPGPFTLSQLAEDHVYDSPGALAMAFAEAVNAEVRALHAAGADIVQLDEPYLEARRDAAHEYAMAAVTRALAGAAGATALHLCFGYGPIDRGHSKSGRYALLPELERTPVDIVSLEAAQPGVDAAVLRDLPSKLILWGCLDLGTTQVDTQEVVLQRIRAAINVAGAQQVMLGPDCGMKYLPRAVAEAKLRVLVSCARIARG